MSLNFSTNVRFHGVVPRTRTKNVAVVETPLFSSVHRDQVLEQVLAIGAGTTTTTL
jgi:hypothetical protein